MWLITTLLYIYRLCLRLSRLLVAVNSALRMDLTFRQDLSVDLWVLVVGFLQTFSEVSGKMISLIMLGLLRAQYINPDLLSKKKIMDSIHRLVSSRYLKSIPAPTKRVDFPGHVLGKWVWNRRGKQIISDVPLIWHNFLEIFDFHFH